MKIVKDILICALLAAASLFLLTVSGCVVIRSYNGIENRIIERLSPPTVQPPAASEVKNNPVVKPEQNAAETQLSAVQSQTVQVLDMDRLMQMSRPGMIITDYITKYNDILDENIKKIEEATAKAEKDKNIGLFAALNNDRQYLIVQKNKVAGSASKYLRDIVIAVLKKTPLPDGTILIDAKSSYTPGKAVDFTDEMIRRLSNIAPKMPELPQPNLLSPDQPETQKPAGQKVNPSAPAKKRPKRSKSIGSWKGIDKI